MEEDRNREYFDESGQEDDSKVKINTGMRFGKSIGMAGAIILAASLGVSGTLAAERFLLHSSSAVSAVEEGNLDIGGRISDRVEDVNDAVTENTELIRDTKSIAETSNQHYEEIKGTLEKIKEELASYESTESDGDEGAASGAESGSDLIREDAKAVTTEDISYDKGKEISEALNRILSDMDDLMDKTESGSKETKSMLSAIEDAEDKDMDTIEDILDSYYLSISQKNENINSSLTKLENSMTDTIEKLENTEGNHYDALADLLNKSAKELTGTVDADVKAVQDSLDAERTELTGTINDGVDKIARSLSEKCDTLGSKMDTVRDEEAENRRKILSSIENAAAEQDDRLDDLADSLSRVTGEDGEISGIHSRMEQMITGQEELALQETDNGKKLDDVLTSLSDSGEEIDEMNDTVNELQRMIEALAEEKFSDDVIRKEHEALRSTLAQCGVELEEDAAIEEYCNAIRSLKEKNTDEQTIAEDDADPKNVIDSENDTDMNETGENSGDNSGGITE